MKKPSLLIVALLLSGGACGGDESIDRPEDGNNLGGVQRQGTPTSFSPGSGAPVQPAAGGAGGVAAPAPATLPPVPAAPQTQPATPPVAQPVTPPGAQPTTPPVAQPTTPPVAQPTTPPVAQPTTACSGKSVGQSCGASSCESETHRVDQVCNEAGQCVQNKVKCEDWCSAGSCTSNKDHGNGTDKDNKDKDKEDKEKEKDKD